MKSRLFWIKRIESLWGERSVLWLSGVRRAGKTCLCRSLKDCEYYDCELPRVRQAMDNPQEFLESHRRCRMVLDEIHRLANPSELLKIAADHYPDIRILATGSSTLGASAKFRDTLTGRKNELWLTPMTVDDLADFGRPGLAHRFLHGGLPPLFLASKLPERHFQEWIDAYWAKDILELFRLERRQSFQQFLELLLAQSGGIFDASKFARPCGVSHTTIGNYLKVLEATFVAHVIRPFSSYRTTEIVAAPKVYGFDTGFVCYYRGWHELRHQDYGVLWEHFVLNELFALMQNRRLHYWRDKQGHEVDFIFIRKNEDPVSIECKWKAEEFDASNLLVFRRHYPDGRNIVVASDVERPFLRTFKTAKVMFVSLSDLPHDIGLGLPSDGA